MAFVYAKIVPSWADQLRSTTAFDRTILYLPSQYRHIEHMHEGVWLKKSFLTK